MAKKLTFKWEDWNEGAVEGDNYPSTARNGKWLLEAWNDGWRVTYDFAIGYPADLEGISYNREQAKNTARIAQALWQTLLEDLHVTQGRIPELREQLRGAVTPEDLKRVGEATAKLTA